MSNHQQSKEELLELLGNCLLALSLTNDEKILVRARAAADQHVEELEKRFPDWKDELHSIAKQNEELKRRETS